MDEQDIELLKTLIDTQNITKTAKKLYTTQSSLTNRIQKMEQDLGCQLFIRSRKGILPTPAAEGIFPEIEKISQSMEHIRAYALSLQGEICGSLKIGVSVNIARYKLPAVLKTFMKKYPKVDIYVTTMQSTQLYRALADNEISIALVRGNFNWQDGDVILSREPVCLVRNQEMAELSLKDIPYIGRHTDSPFYDRIEQWKQENGCANCRTQLWIDDISSCLEMVENGIGWSILPEICLKNYKGSITPLFFQDGSPFIRTSHILYKSHYFELPQVRAFIQTVLAEEYFNA